MTDTRKWDPMPKVSGKVRATDKLGRRSKEGRRVFDAVDWKGMTDTPESLVKELAEADPVYRDVDADALCCVLCDAKVEKQEHSKDCLWLRAKKLAAWSEEQAQRIAAADPPPTQGPEF
jgi:hypothetical protein